MGLTGVGILYPGPGPVDEFPRWVAPWREAVRTYLAVTESDGTHTGANLRAVGDLPRLAAGLRLLPMTCVAAVIWACTSGSFILGLEGSRRQAEMLGRAAGVPADNTTGAFLAAADALGLTRVAVAATYPEPVASHFSRLLAAAGLEVVAMRCLDLITGQEATAMPPAQTAAWITACDHPEAEAMLVPDTALRTLELFPGLEFRLRKPLLTANQVTVWRALRLAGFEGRRADYGVLWTRG